MAAAMASAMPVLPEVGSIKVSPGLIRPRFSASTTIESAGRSLTDAAGLFPSSLASSTLLVSPGRRCSFPRGVSPTVSSMVLYMKRKILACEAAARRGDPFLLFLVLDAEPLRVLDYRFELRACLI